MTQLNHAIKTACLALMLSGLSAIGYTENYIGLGIGQSMFDPDDGQVAQDDKDTAAAIFLGRDFSQYWSGEIYFHDLGTATIDNGDVDASALGLSAIFHWPNNNDDWSVYGRLGAAHLSQDTNGASDNETELGHGLGVRWNFKESWFSRLEYRGYGEEVSAVFLNAAYTFGGTGEKAKAMAKDMSSEKMAPKEAMVKEKVAEKKVMVVDTMNEDSDKDGVANKMDKCPGSTEGANVDKNGCPVVITSEAKKAILEKIDLKSVNFKSNSKELTDSSKVYLDTAAKALKASSTIKLEIQAYTDSGGADAYNLKLSEQRASTVKSYLVAKGIDASRLTAKGFGETDPVADNATAEGRAQNRRVEFQVID